MQSMSSLGNYMGPTGEDFTRPKHLLRYLKGTSEYALCIFPHYSVEHGDKVELVVYVDSDWAGWPNTRNSTSGVVLHLWGCAVHHYSRTRQSIAASSCEAELHAIGPGAAAGLQVVTGLREIQMFRCISLRLGTGSTTAKSISVRFGPGKNSKHTELRFLFIQDLVHSGIVTIKEVPSPENSSGCLTR